MVEQPIVSSSPFLGISISWYHDSGCHPYFHQMEDVHGSNSNRRHGRLKCMFIDTQEVKEDDVEQIDV